MSKKFNFFRESVKNYKTSGTIAPSSRFLAQRMLKNIDFTSANVIVELGPGNGAITEHILKKLHPKATLICFEINDAFYNELLKIDHPQLVVLKKSAENIQAEVTELGFAQINHIISSLPLTIIPKKISKNILKESYTNLAVGGTFIQYQYSLTYYKQLKGVFKEEISLDFEPLNIPPAFVYRCKKVH